MKKINKKGFTVVELVIVIAIIAVLAAVLIPTFVSLVQKANESVDIQAIRQMNTSLSAGAAADGTLADVNAARGVLLKDGFNSDNLIPMLEGHSFWWYSTDNVVLLVDKANKVVYPEKYEGKSCTEGSSEYFGTGTTFPLAGLPYAKIEEINVAALDKSNTVESGTQYVQPESPLTLDKALMFTAQHTAAQAKDLEYGDYYVDYVITINKNLDAAGAKYYLAGKYGSYEDGKWVLMDVTKDGNGKGLAGDYKLLTQILRLDEAWTYEDVCALVNEFQCGIKVDGVDKDLTVTVKLVMWPTLTDYEEDTNRKVINTYVYSYGDN